MNKSKKASVWILFLSTTRNIHCKESIFLLFAGDVSFEVLPGVLGIQGEGLFIFRDLGRRVIYFQGYGEKA